MQISHLFAGKPQPFGSRGAPSSIIKSPFQRLHIKYDGAIEDEQGNKKLHGGPYMALHQYAQASYTLLNQHYPNSKVDMRIGSIGENISAPNMHEHNVFIGDQFAVGTSVIQVVSPRAPCSKINYRYGINRIDTFVAEQAITGWYYSVLKEGIIEVNDTLTLVDRAHDPLSVAQIWRLRECIKQSPENKQSWLDIAEIAINTRSLAPEWQAFANRALSKLSKAC